MENEKKEENKEKDNKENQQINSDSTLKETGIEDNRNIEIKENQEEKEKIIEQIPEIDNRTITPEIIDIINKETYKKYRGKENQLYKLKITKDENFSENQILINIADLLQIKQIKLSNIETNDFNSLLSEKSLMIKKFQKIKSEKESDLDNKDEEKLENKIEEEIYLEEIIFNNCNIDINFGNIFPLIKKLILKNCKISYDISNKLCFNYLTHLILENIGLIDDNVQSLFYRIRENDSLKNNLKKISLKNNSISIFDPCKGIIDIKTQIEEILGLSNLEILDLSNNKIVFISSKMLNALKNIKLINLTNNGIIFPWTYKSFLEQETQNLFLVLLTKNYALSKNKNKEEYINYLLNIFPKIDLGFNSISLINLYTSQFYEKMKTINLTKYNNTLIELDISYGSIKDNEFKDLFKSNLALVNLKYLNISKNKLTEKILDILLENDFPKQFNKLKKLDLSGNMLQFKQAKNYQNFFETFKSLKLFIAKNTPFELSINNYTKTIVNRYYEMKRENRYRTNFSSEDLEIEKIVENDNYLVKNTNVTINILDVNNYKYISQVKKYFAAILERIDFETRYYESK